MRRAGATAQDLACNAEVERRRAGALAPVEHAATASARLARWFGSAGDLKAYDGDRLADVLAAHHPAGPPRAHWSAARAAGELYGQFAALNPWLGDERGYLSDWFAQRSFELVGKQVSEETHPWLVGPTGCTAGTGTGCFEKLAEEQGQELRWNPPHGGLTQDFDELASDRFDADGVDPRIVRFYEHTVDFELDAWGSPWRPAVYPIGFFLRETFSRRIGQLNFPRLAYEMSRGLTSDIAHFVNPDSGEVEMRGWMRTVCTTGDPVYVAAYSTCVPPNRSGRCVKVTFPLPNGSAVAILEPRNGPDGSLILTNAGRTFGDPGLYLTVRSPRSGVTRATYVRAFKEALYVYVDSEGQLRTENPFNLCGFRFLSLHFKISDGARRLHPQYQPPAAIPAAAPEPDEITLVPPAAPVAYS